jgi:ribosome-associated protein
LQQLIDTATATSAPRRPTKPTRSSQRRRVDAKVARGRIKSARGRVDE